MNWENARLFLAVSRAGQLLGAARVLGLNQATLSRRIAALETELKTQLLIRRTHGCELTEDGRRLAAALERVETEMLDAGSALGGRDAAISGTVRIGAPDGFGVAFLAPKLHVLAARHPQLDLQLVPVPRRFSLSQREADIAIMVGRPEKGRLIARRLTDYTLGLYAAADYLEKRPPVERLSDLADHRLIGYVEDLIFTPSLNYARDIWRGWRNQIEVSSTIGQLEAVRAGAGIGILHDYLVTDGSRLVRVLPDQYVKLSYWMVYHEDLRNIARVCAVANFLVEIVAEASDAFMASVKRQADP